MTLIMKFIITGLVQLIFCLQLFSQTKYVIKPENADCKKAIEIKDTIFGPTNAPVGYGSDMEILGDKNSPYAFEREHNTCWYFFKSKNDCRLEIDIIPEKIGDDYDFLLYKYSGRTFCQDVADKKINPIRSCISRNDRANGSKTGLSEQAPDEFIHSGPGASYSKYLTVKKGEIYYLCLDNVYPNGGGHTIILRYSGCNIPQLIKQTEKKVVVDTPAISTRNMPVKIVIVDKESQLPVKTNIFIYNDNIPGKEAILKFDSVSNCVADLPMGSKFTVKAEANSYFDISQKFKTNFTGKEITVKLELNHIQVGQNVVFENILFFGNSARYLPECKPVLESIATTMKRNPRMEIEIQGHVNCPTGWSDCDDKTEFNIQLSLGRAKSVYDFLVEAGISPDRLTYKGFGATQMIYPNARSEEKMAKNRRVEIVIKAF
jgi:outer membrane protein OmpA-like peptidoglycan-associated protein